MASFKKRHNPSKKARATVRDVDDAYLKAYLEVEDILWDSDDNTPCLTDDDEHVQMKQKKTKHLMKQKQKQTSHIQTKEEAMEQEHAQTNKYGVLEIKENNDPFDRLSNEMMLKTFSYLSLASLSQCAQVAHRWKRLSYDKQFWRVVNLDCRKLTVDGLLGRILHRGVHILRLSRAEVRAQICDNDCSYKDDDRCSSFELTHLDASVTKFTEDYLTNLLFKCESLVNLSLEGCKIAIPEVTAISLNGRLEVLNLTNVIGLTLPAVDAITRSCLKLKILNVSWTNQTRDAIRYISRCKYLEELNMSGLRGGINRTMMELLVTSCKNLKSLDFSDVTLQIGTLKLIADNCRYLQKLSISRCTDVKAEQLFDLVRMANLSHLNLFGFISSDALQRFTDERPDIYVNKETFSPIARPISTSRYEGRLWEQYVGFII